MNWQFVLIAAAGVFAIAVIIIMMVGSRDKILDALRGVPVAPPPPAERYRRIWSTPRERLPLSHRQ